MKRKNEVPDSIRLYHALLLNETGFNMLTFRSDDGKENISTKETLGGSLNRAFIIKPALLTRQTKTAQQHDSTKPF